MFKSIALVSCLAIFGSFSSGCCPPVEPKPDAKIMLQGEILVSENANPDQDGHSSPVTIRIYQLKSGNNFKNADFLALYGDDESVLDTDLLFKEEMDVHPGTRIPFDREWGQGTRYLGVMAIFQDRETARWRALVDLPDKGDFPVLVKIENSSVSIWQEAGSI
ncbi:MAG: type VI secretion system protein VasD [Candidatus Kentron sp. G]|nr:MAG: type VI secretion system protein VasD [Candidatus Kentron sp. G]VFN03405.1 MAG: type VI secretion system protein VasD [Candidatus Kentron sp. G]VFN03472.1 MAG: type VI secretion system protein VasD [Candidatus Kentron sp. G]